jgi:hypothetical protein
MTLAQLRTASRQRADMVNSTFISDAELNSYINASYFELYDLLVQKYGNDYYMTEYSFSLVGNVSRYPLPADFFKLLGVDLQISGGPDGYVSLRPFTLAERNRYSTANVQTWIGVTNLRYRISGNDLWFTPSPQTGQTIRIWYIPRLAELVDPTAPAPLPPNAPNDWFVSIGVNSTVVAGDTITIDGTVFTAVNGAPGSSTEFDVDTGGDNTLIAQNLYAAIVAQSPSYTVTLEDPSSIFIHKSSLFTVTTTSVDGFTLDGVFPIVGKMTFAANLLANDTLQIGDVLFTAIPSDSEPSEVEFQIGSSISQTIGNIQVAVAEYAVAHPEFVAPLPVLTSANQLSFYSATEMYFACSNVNVTTVVYNSTTIVPPVVVEPNTVADGISGWLEYVITDACIKMLQKEESDTTVFQIQKAALIRRIEAAAENRDAGNPATIADVQWTNGTWPFGNGFGGGGGIP